MIALRQLDLFDHVLDVYAAAGGPVSNAALYQAVAGRAGLDRTEFERKEAIGRAGEQHSPLKRRVRWWQQSLRQLGLLERKADERGVWSITPKGKRKLTPAAAGRVLLGFSTDLGVALWASSNSVFASLDEPIALCLSSPPYPLACPRAYGNPAAAEYVDWLCGLMEPIVKHLVPGGSICLNISQDIHEPGSPARSLYVERLVIALHDRLGLHLMDRLIWRSNKAPGPVRWASISRQQLNVAYEPVFWFTNDPKLCRSDNRRVLQAHSERHLALIRRGGEQRTSEYGDGAYRLRHGSYGNETPGRILRNVIDVSNRCPERDRTRRQALAQGLPAHGATMPVKLAELLIEFLTEQGDLVVDGCGGWVTTGRAAENLGRRWLVTELMGEHVLGGALRFQDEPGFELYGSLQQAA
ncbi:site-specific DNA-methyltransferase [Rubrivivax gelatinosus]|uniref:site-specific DNA-methyltransferase n=1 Tax=Rubrivivax gelatinosus TaxID=28068 RepID=UPI0005C14C6D|nr:site-specific DNA-methyltransferase [Rubrivivax gelatinosus]MBG6083085.1 site-specific DNA-methyltransferase (cytosine-N4-specific) [Rubrivivax gelatinosus]